MVLLVSVPPLQHGASIFANFNDLQASLRALTLNAVGPVLATMCAVAWRHTYSSRGSAMGGCFRPRGDRLADRPARGRGHHAPPGRSAAAVSSIEGEGLFNDAIALVAYRVAVAAVVAETFSFADAA